MASAAVYIGPWTDLSLQGIYQRVITLNVRDGTILIAALSTFITFVGTSFWSLIAFWLHQIRATPDAQDGLYFQHQALYRNAGTPVAVFTGSLKMLWAWRKPRKRERRVEYLGWRTFKAAIPPLMVVLCFTVASVFVSKVAGTANDSNDVLLKSDRCGYWVFNTSTPAGYAAYQQKIVNDTVAGRSYATSCYDKTNTTSVTTANQCGLYPVASLPYDINNVSCPFGSDRNGDSLCLPAGNTALQFITQKLDSSEMFGINAPPEHRITIRKSLTCAPLRIKNYTTFAGVSDSDGTYYFNLGPIAGISNFTWAYRPAASQLNIGYQVISLLSGPLVWNPIKALQVAMGDTTMFFVAPNTIQYLTPVDDLFYAAHYKKDYGSGLVVYLPDHWVSAMGCVDQYEICNPLTNPPSCTILGNFAQMSSGSQLINLNIHQNVTALRFILALQEINSYASVAPLSTSALLAQRNIFGSLTSTGLPANQWQVEADGWFKTSLAKLQAFIVDYASNSIDPGSNARLLKFNNNVSYPNAQDQALLDQCGLQRVRNTGAYMTFSVLGLGIIVGVGLLITLLYLIVEPLVALFRSFRKVPGKKDYKEIARVADGMAQLQRMALVGNTDRTPSPHSTPLADRDERYSGYYGGSSGGGRPTADNRSFSFSSNQVWEAGLDAIPVTKSGVKFSPPVRVSSASTSSSAAVANGVGYASESGAESGADGNVKKGEKKTMQNYAYPGVERWGSSSVLEMETFIPKSPPPR